MKIDRTGGLFIVSAPSGTGKSTVIGQVRQALDNLAFSVSYTTREPREGEQHGIHYHFVSDPEFKRMIGDGAFLEHAVVFGRFHYGTARKQVQDLLDAGKDVIMDIDVQGACQIMEQHDIPFTAIFLVPPSMAELKTRLRERNREGEEELAGRLETAREELKQMHRFDFVVVNDELDRAVDVMKSIISAERHRVSRIRDLEQLNIQLIRED